MAQLEISGTLIELEEKIKYNFQVNDIAEIADRQATYTNSFKVPRTKAIVELFEGLGIAGDTSGSPYRKVSARLFDNYVPIVEKGWLQIRHTDNRYYHVAVYSGVIDFFKAIENQTTEDIDFSDLAHVKNPANIVATWQNDLDYRYFVADYTIDGNPQYRTEQLQDAWDAGSLQPSFKIAWLWDKIFDKYGFTYSGTIFNTNDFKSRYITYPKVRLAAVTERAAELRKFQAGIYTLQPDYPLDQSQWRPFSDGNPDNRYDFFQINGQDVIEGTSDGWRIRILEDGVYQFDIRSACTMREFDAIIGLREISYWVRCWRGGTTVINRESPPGETLEISENIILNAGDVLDFQFWAFSTTPMFFTMNDFHVNISKADESTGGSDPVLDISLTDFFKEVLWLFGLTAIQDKYSQNIEFLTLRERIERAATVDWSKKYVRRVKEEYVYGYARDNVLAHQYVDDDGQNYDGHLIISNQNLEEKKILITSSFYAPDKRVFERPDGGTSTLKDRYPTVQVEINDDGTVTENMEDRHFLIAGRLKNEQIRIGMQGVPGSDITANEYYEDNFDPTSYNTAVSTYYQELENILNDTRIHTIELCLSPPDIGELDFRKLYYFDQEANYYLLNKLQYQEGKFATAEFVRVKLTRVLGEFSDDFSDDFNN